jgi:hypothetical protein
MVEGEREYAVTSTVSAGFDEKSTDLHDIQLGSGGLDEFPTVAEGGFLKLTSDHDDQRLQFYGRVETRDRERFERGLDRDRIGVGVPGRQALGVTEGDRVTVEPVGFEPVSRTQRLFNRVLRIRPATCRVRKSVFPDSGHKVCRIPEEVKDVVGIEWGDRVIIQSSEARIRAVKALPVRPEQRRKFERRERENPERYPPPFGTTAMNRETGTSVDLPRVSVSAAAREQLGFAEYAHGGVRQSVKIHRDTQDVFVRLLDELTIPFLLGAVAVVVGLDVGFAVKLGVLLCALGLTVLSVGYRSRRVLLE